MKPTSRSVQIAVQHKTKKRLSGGDNMVVLVKRQGMADGGIFETIGKDALLVNEKTGCVMIESDVSINSRFRSLSVVQIPSSSLAWRINQLTAVGITVVCVEADDLSSEGDLGVTILSVSEPTS